MTFDTTDVCCHVVSHFDRPSEIMKFLCRSMDIEAGSYWEKAKSSNNLFILKGLYNRPNIIPEMEKGLSFSRHEKTAAATAAFEDERIYSVKYIGKKPLDQEWMKKEYVQDLLNMGVERICFVPIYDSSGKPYCIFSFYLLPNQKFDGDKMSSFAKLFSVLVERNIDSQSSVENEFRRNIHEIKTSVSIIQNQLGSLSTMRSDISFDTKANKKLFEKKFLDVYKSFRLINKSLSTRDFRQRIEIRKKSSKTMNFYGALNSITQSIINRYNRSDVQLDHFSAPYGVKLRFDETDFRMLMQNIVENSAKHSRKNSSVRVQAETGTYGLKITVSNLCNVSPETNKNDFWEDGYRDALAIERGIPGEGVGMGIIRDICTIYGVTYNLSLTGLEDVTKTDERWFRISLTFPRRLWHKR